MPSEQDRYDAFAYPGHSYPNTHPDRLAVIATLHGLSPAPIERCRVLEVACGDGANIIPMAYAIPAGEFVGFDLARLPIERAQQRIRGLGLRNIRIFQGDILALGADLGRFDYILAHGFYSWVPLAARDRLLALCAELLAPNGIAFVSYNAFPGSHLRLMLRDAMVFRAQGIENPQETVIRGQEFLHSIAASRPEGDAQRAVIEEQLRRLEKHPAAATYHDELNPDYRPLYFTDFVKHARSHGLEFLAEAELPPPQDPSYRAELQQAIEGAGGGNFIQKEQALDFMRIRSYRESLLCRADQPIHRDYFPESFSRLRLASQTSSRPGKTPESRIFELPGGITMETSHPALIWLLERLSEEWPHAMDFRELMPRLAELGLPLDAAGALLLMRLAISKMLELRTWSAPLAGSISERPRASFCTRQEAVAGGPVTTLLHRTFKFEDPKVRSLLLLLDGTRTQAELVQAMREEFPDTPVSEIEDGLQHSLRQIYLAGALEA